MRRFITTCDVCNPKGNVSYGVYIGPPVIAEFIGWKSRVLLEEDIVMHVCPYCAKREDEKRP
jgi:hypothetical protein